MSTLRRASIMMNPAPSTKTRTGVSRVGHFTGCFGKLIRGRLGCCVSFTARASRGM